MSNGPWADAENDRIVADYFAMLAQDIAGQPYNKAGLNRDLQSRIDRNRSSIEFKHQNISAVLKGLGEDWIPGYKPAFNFQMTLADAVARWLALNPAWLGRLPERRHVTGMCEIARLWIGPPPTLSNQPPPGELEQMLHIARKFDVAERDARNRALGRAGEEHTLIHEKAALTDAGRSDLARRVRWLSDEDGDGAGYDIESFAPDGRPRLIEVKTTNGWERTPFHISRNELAVAKERRAEWCLMRLWNFSREPKAFELRPPLDAHVSLTAMSFQASFHWGQSNTRPRCSSHGNSAVPHRSLIETKATPHGVTMADGFATCWSAPAGPLGIRPIRRKSRWPCRHRQPPVRLTFRPTPPASRPAPRVLRHASWRRPYDR